MMPTPIRAWRLPSHARRAVWPPRRSSSGRLAGAVASTATAAGSSCVAMTNPRVKNAVGEVGREVPHHGRDADDQRAAEQDGEVVLGRRLEEEQAHALEVEHFLGDER